MAKKIILLKNNFSYSGSFLEKNLRQTFLKRLDDIKSKTNRNKDDQSYISKKRVEFTKLYDISKEKHFKDLEIPEYIAASPSKKAKNDKSDDESENEIPDLEEDEEEFDEKDVDLDDPDWEHLEEEGEEKTDEEFENSKPKKRRCNIRFSRTTAAAIRFGISTRAICILIWAFLMGKNKEFENECMFYKFI